MSAVVFLHWTRLSEFFFFSPPDDAYFLTKFCSLNLLPKQPLTHTNHRASSRSVSLSAETAEWTAPAEWKEKDFESQIKKLEKEAEERLDTKIDELKRNIASTGKSD